MTVTLKLANSSGKSHPIEVPISKDWTPERKRDEILKWINNYTVNGNKPFLAAASGVNGMSITDSADNFLEDITILDRTKQSGIGEIIVDTTTGKLIGAASLDGKPTGLDPQGAPAIASAGLEGAYVAQINTQGAPSACAILEDLRQDLVQNNIAAEIDESGDLVVPLDVPGATAFIFGTDDAGIVSTTMRLA